MIVWRMTIDTAQKYYQMCLERNAKTEEERESILKELKDEMLSVSLTKRTPAQLIEDLSKHGDILAIRPKPNTPGFRPDQDNAGSDSKGLV